MTVASSHLPLRPRNAGSCDRDILGGELGADETAMLENGGFARAAGPGERVENQATGRGDEAHEPTHKVGRLHGRVRVVAALSYRLVVAARQVATATVAEARNGSVQRLAAFLAIALAGLGAVEETRRAPLVGVIRPNDAVAQAVHRSTFDRHGRLGTPDGARRPCFRGKYRKNFGAPVVQD